MSNNKSLISDRLNELYKKYFQGSDYNLGQSFESVKENMSNEDYDLSQKLLNYYGQTNTLSDQYNHSNQIIENQRKQALQENSIAREKALKYLPEYLKMQGLGGQGLSESSVISANNAFNNNRNSINAEANVNKNELLKNYNAGVRDLDSNYLDEESDIRNHYLQQFVDNSATNLANLETMILEKLSTMSQDAQGRISIADKEVLKEMVNNSREDLTDEDQKIIDTYISNIGERPQEEVDAENEYNQIKTSDVEFRNNGGWWIFGATDFREGDNFSLKDSSGERYNIESGGKVEDSSIIQAAQKVGNGSIFGYQNKLYYKKDGDIYLIQKRANSYGSHYTNLYKKFYK